VVLLSGDRPDPKGVLISNGKEKVKNEVEFGVRSKPKRPFIFSKFKSISDKILPGISTVFPTLQVYYGQTTRVYDGNNSARREKINIFLPEIYKY
jgi:hypothetical protein